MQRHTTAPNQNFRSYIAKLISCISAYSHSGHLFQIRTKKIINLHHRRLTRTPPSYSRSLMVVCVQQYLHVTKFRKARQPGVFTAEIKTEHNNNVKLLSHGAVINLTNPER